MREGLEGFGVFQNSAYQRHHQHCSLAQKLVAKSKEFQGFFTSFGVIFKHCVQRKLKVQCLPIFTTLSLQRERRIKINPVFGYFQRVFYNHFYWKNLYSASIAIHSGMIGGLSGSKFNDRQRTDLTVCQILHTQFVIIFANRVAVLALNIDYLNNLSKSSIWTLRKKRSSLHSHLRESLESHFTSGSFKRDDWAACARRPFPLFCKSVESEQSQQFLIHNSIRSMQQSVLFSIEFPSLSNCWKNEKVDWIFCSQRNYCLESISKLFFFWIFAFKL